MLSKEAAKRDSGVWQKHLRKIAPDWKIAAPGIFPGIKGSLNQRASKNLNPNLHWP